MSDSKEGNIRIAKNSVFLAIRLVIIMMVSLYISRAVLHTLGVEDFGIYNVTAGFVSMFAFLNSSMTNAIQRFYNFELGKDRGMVTSVFNAAFLIQTALAAVVVLLALTVGEWYIHNKMVIAEGRLAAADVTFKLSVLSFVIIIVQVPFQAATMAHEKMDFYSGVSIVSIILKLILVFLLKYSTYDKLVVYAEILLLLNILEFASYAIFSISKFKEVKFKFNYDKKLIASIFGFTGWNLFGSFSLIGREQGINLLLNSFFGATINAARGIAYQIVSALSSFVNTICIASKPQMTISYAQGNLPRAISLMFSSTKIAFSAIFALGLSIILEVNYILSLWLGDMIPEYTSIFVVLVIVTKIIESVNPPMSYMVHASGKMRDYQLIPGIVCLLVLPVSYYALKHGARPEMVFIFCIVFSLIDQILSLVIMSRIIKLPIKEYVRQIVIPFSEAAAVSLIVPFALRYTLDEGPLRLAVIIPVTFLSVFSAFYYIVFNESERSLCRTFAKKIFKL